MTLLLGIIIFAIGNVFGFAWAAIIVAGGQATERDTIFRLRRELEELKGERDNERET